MLGIRSIALPYDTEGRTAPALVHPAPEDTAAWVVEPPGADEGRRKPRVFTGGAALLTALEYAHRTYGSAVCLSR